MAVVPSLIRQFISVCICFIVFSMLNSTQVLAGERLVINVGGPGKSKIPLALPKPLGKGQAAKQFYDIIRQDLELSGWIDIVDSNSYIEPSQTGVEPSQFKYEDWEITGAVALAKSKFIRDGERTRVEIWVYDVTTQKKLGAKSFSAKNNQLRNLAHKVANEIIYRLTGKKMPFDSKFAVVANFSKSKEIYLKPGSV